MRRFAAALVFATVLASGMAGIGTPVSASTGAPMAPRGLCKVLTAAIAYVSSWDDSDLKTALLQRLNESYQNAGCQ